MMMLPPSTMQRGIAAQRQRRADRRAEAFGIAQVHPSPSA
jgi:hypothetical protein